MQKYSYPNTVRVPPKSLRKKVFGLMRRMLSKLFRNFYYTARESIGEHKRDIVVYQVEQACSSLQETRNEFEDALGKFRSLVNVNEAEPGTQIQPAEPAIPVLPGKIRFGKRQDKGDRGSQRTPCLPNGKAS